MDPWRRRDHDPGDGQRRFPGRILRRRQAPGRDSPRRALGQPRTAHGHAAGFAHRRDRHAGRTGDAGAHRRAQRDPARRPQSNADAAGHATVGHADGNGHRTAAHRGRAGHARRVAARRRHRLSRHGRGAGRNAEEPGRQLRAGDRDPLPADFGAVPLVQGFATGGDDAADGDRGRRAGTACCRPGLRPGHGHADHDRLRDFARVGGQQRHPACVPGSRRGAGGQRPARSRAPGRGLEAAPDPDEHLHQPVRHAAAVAAAGRGHRTLSWAGGGHRRRHGGQYFIHIDSAAESVENERRKSGRAGSCGRYRTGTIRMNKLNMIAAGKLGTALLTLGLLPGFVSAQFGQAAPVEVDQARLMAMAPTMQVAGTVLSRADALLSAEVEGRLLEIAEVGERFTAGDVLARIEDTQLQLRAEELEAEISSVEARLQFLDAELERYQRLAADNLASRTQIDQTRSERDVAQSDLRVARSRLSQVTDQIERTRIRAPFPGVVAQRLVQAGERVATGTQVMRVYNPNDLEVVARAPLSFYRYLQPGDELAVRVNDEVIAAPLRTLVSQGTEQTHVFELRLNLEENLPVGQTVRVTIPTADIREVLAVPRDALVLRGTGTSVFVVDDENNARRVSVAVGIGSENMIEVKGPIQPGDRVVIRGNERLREGQAIEVIQGANTAGTESA